MLKIEWRWAHRAKEIIFGEMQLGTTNVNWSCNFFSHSSSSGKLPPFKKWVIMIKQLLRNLCIDIGGGKGRNKHLQMGDKNIFPKVIFSEIELEFRRNISKISKKFQAIFFSKTVWPQKEVLRKETEIKRSRGENINIYIKFKC